MISSVDVGVLDLNSEHLGIDVRDLMEAAGRALAEEIKTRLPRKRSVLIVAGSGNNGGDGLVAARYLSVWKVPVTLLLARDPSRIRTEIARQAYMELPGDVEKLQLRSGDVQAHLKELMKGKGILVDGLLGSGAKGEPKGDYAEMIRTMNSFKGIKIAIDSPTGFGYEPSFKADLTVTFHDIKKEMMVDGVCHPDCGELIVRKIGIPDAAATYVGPGDLLRVPQKPTASKKGETGRVLVIGGGPYTGAPSLSACAAVRTGADLVFVAVPRGIRNVVASFSPELIVEGLNTLDPNRLGPEVLDKLRQMIESSHSVLIGPGAGKDRATLHLLVEAFSLALSMGKPVVVDADGLTAIAELWKGEGMGGKVILTPHRGELRRLLESFLPEEDPSVLRDPYEKTGRGGLWKKEALEVAAKLQERLGATLLVKGPVDLMLTGDPPSLSDHVAVDLSGGKYYRRYCTTGVPAMSVGGTGDVLSGLCVGLLARGLSAFDAACVAAFVNGKAGEEAFSSVGHSLSASEVLSRVKLLPPK
ncbi:MAG: NAD(P)H-hydrate dehydratase [Thermoplasmatota archaeon]